MDSWSILYSESLASSRGKNNLLFFNPFPISVSSVTCCSLVYKFLWIWSLSFSLTFHSQLKSRHCPSSVSCILKANLNIPCGNSEKSEQKHSSAFTKTKVCLLPEWNSWQWVGPTRRAANCFFMSFSTISLLGNRTPLAPTAAKHLMFWKIWPFWLQ